MPIWTGIALGALSRYYLNLLIQGRLGQGNWASFPLGTLVINVIGSFLLGLGLKVVAGAKAATY